MRDEPSFVTCHMSNIIDSHVHFWDPQTLRYAWLDNEPLLKRAYLTDHVPTQIDGIVFVQAACADEQGLAEVEFVSALAKQDERVRAIVAFAPIEDAKHLRAHLEQLKQNARVKGVRRLIQDEALGFCVQENFIAGVQSLAQFDFTFDICIRHWQLPDAIQLARACPQVNFVLDHCGKPDIKNRVLELWRTHITELAALPNVQCKLSGLVTEADHQNWTPQDLQPYIAHVLDSFGIDRVLFGSDAPVAYLASTYERWIETLRDMTQSLSDAEQKKLWRTNAEDFYRLS